MGKVVDIEGGDEGAEDIGAQEANPRGSRRESGRSKRDPVEVEVEREITKRQLIQSVSSLVVVVLYMLFTLLRERDGGVVVIDPTSGPEDDWAE
jgi:hypothetical protein